MGEPAPSGPRGVRTRPGAHRHRLAQPRRQLQRPTREGAARKSLLLGPERLALALIGDGWTIRNKIVWAKTNTVPTSVRDRLATKHEVIYLLTRSERYYFDLDSLRVPHQSKPAKRKTPADGARRPPNRTDARRPARPGRPGSDRTATATWA